MIKLTAFAVAALTSLYSASVAKPIAYSPITGACPNAEDIVPLPGGRWAIASGMIGPAGPGALFAIDAKTGRARKLYPAETDKPAPESAGCGGEVPKDEFSPHGIAYQPGAASSGTLYVVNHGGRESIEMFSVQMGANAADTPRLVWSTCALTPANLMQNAVAASIDGTIYVTASTMTKGQSLLEAVNNSTGAVLSWSVKHGWSTLPGSEMASPNGILASPDGRKLYVNSWRTGELIELTLGKDKTTRRTLPMDFLVDNLRWGPDGALLTAGQAMNAVPAVISCVTSATAKCAIDSFVASIDPESLSVHCTRSVGPIFATVAAPMGKELWIGSGRSAHISRLPLDVLTQPGCGK